jgi:putative membrane protein
MMWYWGSGVHWWGWLLGALGMVVFWGLIVWAIWFFVTNVLRHPNHTPGSGEAKRILDERLARGDIDAQEYARLRDLMRADAPVVDHEETPVKTGSDQ